MTNPNFLILDEPTNDFDIDTLNVLEDFLDKFTGCLLLVSHDRYFMDHLVNQLFVFEGDGQIRLFNGNYTDYRDWMDEQESPKQKKDKTSGKTEPSPVEQSISKKKPSYKEKQEYETLQSEIAKLEQRKAEVTVKLQSGSATHVELQQWSEEIKTLTKEIDEKSMRWLTLAEIIGS